MKTLVLPFVSAGISGIRRAAVLFCVCLSGYALAAICGVGAVAAGQPARVNNAELLTSISSFEAFLEDKRRTSLTYRVRGKLFVGDFGRPFVEWHLPRIIAGQPPQPASIWLHTIVFHAVCEEDKRAIVSLNWINRNVWGGLFQVDEAEYLDHLAERYHVISDFLASIGSSETLSFQDASGAQRYRSFKQALATGNFMVARRLAGVFDGLCHGGQR